MSIVDDAAHLALVELDEDIFCSLKQEECQKTANAELVRSQPQVDDAMRPRLLEFLAQAQSAYGMEPETFTLAVNVLDRYMSQRVVFARHYQLLGCVCLWLAAKATDSKSKVPTTGALAYLCADTYAESMFREMELHVLTTLEWNIMAPIAADFVDVSLSEVSCALAPSVDANDYEKLNSMARFLCDCALFSPELVGTKASTLAASSVALSTVVLDVVECRRWPTFYPTGCVCHCFEALVSLLSNVPRECLARHEGEVPLYFSDFCRRLAESTLISMGRCLSKRNYYGLESSEPSTPVQSRQVSIDSGFPITPSDEGLTTPRAEVPSPDTYFVPLTPEGAHHPEARTMGSAHSKPFPYYRYDFGDQ